MDNRTNWPEGTLVGPYRIVRLLGEGGMGQVYEAREDRLDRRMALKVLTHLEAESYGQFIEEARTLATLNHPNIVSLYAVDTVNNIPVIAMEYVDGLTMRDLCDRYVMSAQEAAPLFLQVLEALAVIHKNHVLHRDISARNLVLRADGQMKILDFGIAKNMQLATQNTRPGIVAGTLQYMAPEVFAGQPATTRSDLWSLGAVFFECITGEAITNNRIVFNRECLSWVPHEAQRIINRLCALRPEERYASAEQAASDIRRFIAMNAKDFEPLLPMEYKITNLSQIRELKQTQTAGKVRSKRALLLALREWQKRQKSAGDHTEKIDLSSGIEIPLEIYQSQLTIMAVSSLAPKTPAVTRIQPAPRKIDLWPYFATFGILAAVWFLYSNQNAFKTKKIAAQPQPAMPKVPNTPPPAQAPAAPIAQPVPAAPKPVAAAQPVEIPEPTAEDPKIEKLTGLENELHQIIEADQLSETLDQAVEYRQKMEEEREKALEQLAPIEEEAKDLEEEAEKITQKIQTMREEIEASRDRHDPPQQRQEMAEEIKSMAQERLKIKQEAAKMRARFERESKVVEMKAQRLIQEAEAKVAAANEAVQKTKGQQRRPASEVKREIESLKGDQRPSSAD